MRDFLKYTFASLVALSLYSILGVGAFILLLVSILASDSGPQVKNKSVLTFDLATEITDTGPNSSTSEAIQDAIADRSTKELGLRKAIESIDAAAKDSRIVALYLYGSSQSGSTGLATLKELRRALERFRSSGKSIIAYDMNWREREYYLGSVANQVVVNPFGSLEINGFSTQITFLAGALQKYGVGVQVARVGKYKAAVEPLLRTSSSPESRLQNQVLLQDLWRDYLATISQQRQVPVPKLQQATDNQGLLLANEALKLKLVDRVAYLDEVITDLKKLTGNKAEDRSFRQINLISYAQTVTEDKQSSPNEVAVVYAEGEIVDGQGSRNEVGGDRFARQIRSLRLDQDVKAIVLRVNSPGGSVTGSEVIQREVILARKVKPVIVSMGDLAASGGYWISTYSDRIFAEPSTITGSIGVFGLALNIQKLANNQGITWDVVKTGRYADSQTIARPRSEDELKLQQRIVNQIYNQFLAKVAESRKLPKQKVSQIADGRVWSGQSAKKLGLVDEMGGLEDAIRYAAQQAKLGDNWKLKEYPRGRGLEDRFWHRLSNDAAAETTVSTDPLTREMATLWNQLTALKTLNDPIGLYARLPFTLKINE